MKKIIFISVFSYLLFTLANAPASFLVSQLASQIRPLTLNQVTGSVWKGEADISYQGTLLGRHQWSLSALNLLMGNASVELSPLGSPSSITVNQSLWSTKHLDELTIDLISADLDQLHPLASSIQARLSGVINNINPAQCEGVAGELKLQELTFSGMQLGTFTATPACSGKNYELIFTNQGSKIEINGSIILALNGQYRLSSELKTSDTNLRNQLSPLLGQSSNGVYRLNYSGNL